VTISYEPIGIIHTPYHDAAGMPIQPASAAGVKGAVEVFPQFAEGLRDLGGFSHIMLLYHFHESEGYELLVTPYLDDAKRGVFATRAPRRPNPIGVSVVRLTGIDGLALHVENVDMLDGTPLLDIKPYVPQFDNHEAGRIGWLANAAGRAATTKSDGRFKR
jgi:tRNA-Thr(GGU) m(6)t(6)A37 methyltransferase TsaA